MAAFLCDGAHTTLCTIVSADERLFLVFEAETFPKQTRVNGAFWEPIGVLVVPQHDLSLMCSAPVAQRAGLRRTAADGRYGERGMRVRHVYGRAQSVQAPYDIAFRNCLRSLLRVAVVGGTHTGAYPGLFRLVSVYRRWNGKAAAICGGLSLVAFRHFEGLAAT